MLFSFFHSITSSPLIINFLIFFLFPHCKTASERFVIQRGTNKSKIHPGITVSPFYGYGIPTGKSLDGDSDSPYPRTDIKDIINKGEITGAVDIDNMYEFASSHCNDFKDLRDDEDIVINREWILNKLAEAENEQYIWWLHPQAPVESITPVLDIKIPHRRYLLKYFVF